ncbi:hypothetical protein DAERI_010051 [Deinococcus aerius]|uniref:TniQ domain-containing protein n=1 Tax=Deinococcus aerius TaxID=200253 RepID=A0A2I9CR03_9DEIO|nr:TniQ family protein [Deinococcus aerius]GBF03879.1 hypothetical protein DAERI_010051 [Deinococcus aerius]
MRLARRVLNFRVPVIPGETLGSYLIRLSTGLPLKLPLVTLMAHTGLIDEDHVKSIGHAFGVVLEEDRLREFARLTRLDEETVRGMLLSVYHGVAVDLSGVDPGDANSVRLAAKDGWAFFTTTRVCPCCVGENRALLVRWKLVLTFACTKHAVLLADLCPRCGKPFGGIRHEWGGAPLYASLIPQPGVCYNAPPPGAVGEGRSARPCGQDLARVQTIDLRPYPRVLNTQRRIDQALSGPTTRYLGEDRPTLMYAENLRALCASILYGAFAEDLGPGLPPEALAAFEAFEQDRDARLREREELRGKGARRGGPSLIGYRGQQRSSALMAAILPVAVELLDAPNVGELCRRMAWLVARVQDLKRNKIRLAAIDFNFAGPLLEAFNLVLAPNAEFPRRVGNRSPYARHGGEGYAFSAEHVPQLLWEDEYRRAFQPLLTGTDVGDDPARRVISMNLVKLAEDVSWLSAAHTLGLPPSTATGSANNVMGVITTLGRSEDFALALHDLAYRLSTRADKVDYAARRRAFENYEEVPYDTWCELLRGTGRDPGHLHGKHRVAAAWVWARVTEGDWRLSPAFQQGPLTAGTYSELYRRFRLNDLPRLQPVLEAYAQSLVPTGAS